MVTTVQRDELREKRRELLADAEKLAGMGSFEWDVRNDRVTWSDGLYAIYGLSPDEFEASFEAFIAQLHPEDREPVRVCIERAFQGGEPFAMEERVVRPDGSIRFLRSKGQVVMGEGGAPERLIGVCQDVTEAKRAEQLAEDWNRTLEERVRERTRQLADANEKLQAMQHHVTLQARMASVGNLVAGIAHEVNSPVGAVQGAADVIERCASRILDLFDDATNLEDLRGDPRLEKSLDALRDGARTSTAAGHRLTEIVERLTFLAQLDEAPRGRLRLQEAVDAVLAVLRHETSGRIEIAKDYGDVPEIECEPGPLNQAFMSLLLNAAQAIDGPGEIRISIWEEDGWASVRVEDDGRGIAPERLEGLFDIGFQSHQARVRLGTGLFNAYNVVQKHGGDIHVESAPGRGSAFTVRLPLAGPERLVDRD